jgi:succinate dehydrogenase/fumarate reductase cytochrome b subunit
MTNQDLVLWQKLQQAGMVTGDMPNTEIQAQPWYLRVLQGLTGWFAAWFLLGSVFVIFKDLVREQSIAFSWACCLLQARILFISSKIMILLTNLR